MDERDDEGSPLTGFEAEVRELLGLFDVPAFARRGQDLEIALVRLRARAQHARLERLEMVRLRLRQWAAASTGPVDAARVFAQPIDDLWPLAGADAPKWAAYPASRGRQRAIARDLIASVERFNARWSKYLDEIDLGPINRQVDQYNRYYLLEKEIALGSARLAARHFTPKEPVRIEEIRAALPLLPVPSLR